MLKGYAVVFRSPRGSQEREHYNSQMGAKRNTGMFYNNEKK